MTDTTHTVPTHARRGFVRHGAITWHDYFTFNTDHKVIGIQYFVTTFFFFLLGGLLAMLIRYELLTPAADFDPGTYNVLFTIHGSIMIFLWVIPGLAGFGNYLIPLMIGADDMAFPRLNAVSFWMLLLGGLIIVAGFLVGQANAGWTSYPPLSLQAPSGQNLWLIGVLVLGFSSMFGAINFLVTLAFMRAPGLTLGRLPLFCWGMIATSVMVVGATPVLAAALIMQLLDRTLGTTFFRPEAGGDPVMWQHMFWFYSHPAVYIMILPAMGIISEVLPVFSRKPIFGYKAIAASSMAIALFGYLVWGHHMFTVGLSPALLISFMGSSMAIGVPTGIKIFNWLGTVWGGRVELRTPMLFALGFVGMFVIGGLSGITVAAVPVDFHVHDTYYIVAHIHYVLFGGSVFALYAGLYFWFPKITGRMYRESWGKLHFWLNFIGFNLTFLPQHLLGLSGMPRRVAEYDPQFQFINQLSSVGGFLLGISVLPFLVNAVLSWAFGPKASDNPWRALTLEWQTTSPPPIHNFAAPPVVTHGPYDYGLGVVPHGVEAPAARAPAPAPASD
ncbi:MAG: cytochrome c oxidase subunit I [Anaerolineales bacterium]